MSEPTCQWCGAAVRQVMRNDAGEPVLVLFVCQSSQWYDGPWHIGNHCQVRCAEQMRRLRRMNYRAVRFAIDSVTEGHE